MYHLIQLLFITITQQVIPSSIDSSAFKHGSSYEHAFAITKNIHDA